MTEDTRVDRVLGLFHELLKKASRGWILRVHVQQTRHVLIRGVGGLDIAVLIHAGNGLRSSVVGILNEHDLFSVVLYVFVHNYECWSEHH